MTHVAWIIPLLPLAAFGLIIFWGERLPGRGAYVSIAGIVLAALASLAVLGEVVGGARADLTYAWAIVGRRPLTVGVLVDPLSAMMLAMVGVVASLITIYSVGYMEGDPRYPRFFAYFSLFQFSMFFLVLADNFLFLYMAWELVGLCSYLLIGFWFERPVAARAALKAFITTRIGDFFLMIGILLVFLRVGSLRFDDIFRAIDLGGFGGPVLTVAALLVFGGAVGKSAQVPLHVWLPDAMEGPTPVSALIHAATMVAAGAFLVARTYPLFFHSPGHEALTGVAYVGGITALFAATMGLVEDDIKRVLAYSTMSQLGYMMLGLGVLGYSAGMFHLITHAFFKALLFLAAGSVIHAVATNSLKQMGGLARAMPVTFWTFLAGALALTGIPPFAGVFSKDAILLAAFTHDKVLWLLAAAGAFLTSLYMGRLCWYAFAGEYRGALPALAHGQGAGHGGSPRNVGQPGAALHESPSVMTVPLVILAVFSVFLGWAEGPFDRFVRFAGVEAPPASLGVLLVSVLVAVAGWLAAGVVYFWRIVPSEDLRRAFGPVYTLLVRKYYVDDLYAWVVLGLGGPAIRLAGLFDHYVVDGLVNLTGWVARQMGLGLRYVQTGRAENYLLLVFLGVVVIVLVTLAW
ncbi:MAG TPA: NADH-quinone oxidoreductase subunit L [bacterium]|nr:NADH-quinone oxidoreductase subunit L [bacterium]